MIALAFAFGLLAGSFLNVCIHRWPREQSVISPRSRCTKCSGGIAWYDNIPLLSYLLLLGRCRRCDQAIPWRYPLVEFLTAATLALVAATHGFGLEAARAALLASMLIVLFFTDLERMKLPDEVTIGGIVSGITFSVFVPLPSGVADVGFLIAGGHPPAWLLSLTESLAGAILFGSSLYLIGEAYYRLRGIDGLGLGDVKLVAMIAAFLGTSEALLVLLLGCLLATVVGCVSVAVKRAHWRTPLPFGSYLSGAALVTIFAGDAILNRYWEFVLG